MALAIPPKWYSNISLPLTNPLKIARYEEIRRKPYADSTVGHFLDTLTELVKRQLLVDEPPALSGGQGIFVETGLRGKDVDFICRFKPSEASEAAVYKIVEILKETFKVNLDEPPKPFKKPNKPLEGLLVSIGGMNVNFFSKRSIKWDTYSCIEVIIFKVYEEAEERLRIASREKGQYLPIDRLITALDKLQRKEMPIASPELHVNLFERIAYRASQAFIIEDEENCLKDAVFSFTMEYPVENEEKLYQRFLRHFKAHHPNDPLGKTINALVWIEMTSKGLRNKHKYYQVLARALISLVPGSFWEFMEENPENALDVIRLLRAHLLYNSENKVPGFVSARGRISIPQPSPQALADEHFLLIPADETADHRMKSAERLMNKGFKWNWLPTNPHSLEVIFKERTPLFILTQLVKLGPRINDHIHPSLRAIGNQKPELIPHILKVAIGTYVYHWIRGAQGFDFIFDYLPFEGQSKEDFFLDMIRSWKHLKANDCNCLQLFQELGLPPCQFDPEWLRNLALVAIERELGEVLDSSTFEKQLDKLATYPKKVTPELRKILDRCRESAAAFDDQIIIKTDQLLTSFGEIGIPDAILIPARFRLLKDKQTLIDYININPLEAYEEVFNKLGQFWGQIKREEKASLLCDLILKLIQNKKVKEAFEIWKKNVWVDLPHDRKIRMIALFYIEQNEPADLLNEILDLLKEKKPEDPITIALLQSIRAPLEESYKISKYLPGHNDLVIQYINGCIFREEIPSLEMIEDFYKLPHDDIFVGIGKFLVQLCQNTGNLYRLKPIPEEIKQFVVKAPPPSIKPKKEKTRKIVVLKEEPLQEALEAPQQTEPVSEGRIVQYYTSLATTNCAAVALKHAVDSRCMNTIVPSAGIFVAAMFTAGLGKNKPIPYTLAAGMCASAYTLTYFEPTTPNIMLSGSTAALLIEKVITDHCDGRLCNRVSRGLYWIAHTVGSVFRKQQRASFKPV